jgi:hypothetical protein
MTGKHTPGPWEPAGSLVRTKVDDHGGEGLFVADCYKSNGRTQWNTDGSADANAALCAAAPVMKGILWTLTEAIVTKNVQLLMETIPKTQKLLLSLPKGEDE